VPDQTEQLLPAITECLDDADSQVRGMAVWCLVRLGRADQLGARPSLLSDQGEAVLYSEGEMVRFSVGAMTQQALAA
jgi:hypothetical protein